MPMFTIDKQILSDLNAIRWNSFSLLDFLDNTITVGGRDVLYDYFLHPLNDQKQIQRRQEAIAYLAEVEIEKLFDSQSRFSHYLDKFSTNYRLASGVADKKLGMWFLEREKVFDTFKQVKSAK